MNPDNDTFETVAELVRQRPERGRVFEEYGIDFCCHGQVPLDQACKLQRVNLVELCRKLAEAESAAASDERDWTQATLTELTEHIVAVHHTYLRRELPRLAGFIDHGRWLEAGGPANVVVFDPDCVWTPARFESRSQNSPWLGTQLRGRPVATIHKGRLTSEVGER